jgi:hypothetical protein
MPRPKKDPADRRHIYGPTWMITERERDAIREAVIEHGVRDQSALIRKALRAIGVQISE